MTNAASAIQQRLDNLLTVRVFATLAVVVGHAASFSGSLPWTQHPPGPYLQSQAVTLFFFVSGYTISWVCDRDFTAGRTIGDFVFDRATRLLVPLIPLLILEAGAEWLLYREHPYTQNFSLLTLIGNVLFLQNIDLSLPGIGSFYNFGIGVFGTNRPLWTISIEFWLYVAYAGIAFGALTLSRMRIIPVALSLFGLMALNSPLGGPSGSLLLVWLFGAVAFYALRYAPLAPRSTRFALLPIVAFIAAHLFWPRNWPADGTYSYLYTIMIGTLGFAFVALCPALGARWKRLMRFFGDFSYTTYLAHYPVLQWLASSSLLPKGTIGALAGVAIALIVSGAFGLIFEARYKRIRDYIRGVAGGKTTLPRAGL